MASGLNLYVRMAPGLDAAKVLRALPPLSKGSWRTDVVGELVAVDLRSLTRSRPTASDEEVIELAPALSKSLGAEVILLAYASANDSVIYSHVARGKVLRHIRTHENACIASAGKPEPWERPFLAEEFPGERLKGISKGMDGDLDAKSLSSAIADHLGVDKHAFRA